MRIASCLILMSAIFLTFGCDKPEEIQRTDRSTKGEAIVDPQGAQELAPMEEGGLDNVKRSEL